jgi:hypothetical protein
MFVDQSDDSAIFYFCRDSDQEIEVNLEDDRNREALLRLVSILAEKNPEALYLSSNDQQNSNLLNDLPSYVKADEYGATANNDDDGVFQDDEVLLRPADDLGYYGGGGPGSIYRNPYESSYNKPISIMSSGDPTDLTRLGLHLSEVPGSHGLYLSHQQQKKQAHHPKLGLTLPSNRQYGGNHENEDSKFAVIWAWIWKF